MATHYGGAFLKGLAWIEDGVREFSAATDVKEHGPVWADQYASMYSYPMFVSKKAVRVESFDIARWMQETFRPDDEIVMRMDIEGAEYEVIRRLIMAGVGCWLDKLYFEGHAAYAPELHRYRAVDVVVPWLLESCGVNVTLERFYCTPGTFCDPAVRGWEAHDPRTSCVECATLDEPLARMEKKEDGWRMIGE